MLPYVLRRTLEGLIVLWLLVTTVFFVIRIVPGGPEVALANPEFLTPEVLDQIRRSLGLDAPLPQQYASYLSSLAEGDLGYSYSRRTPVADLIVDRVWATLLLGFSAFVVALVGGVLLGSVIAWKRDHFLGRVLRPIPVIAVTTPDFWLGLILLYLFAIQLGALPSGGMSPAGEGASPLTTARHLVLPTIALSLTWIGNFAMYTSSSLTTALQSDYVRTARAKGASEGRILFRHALRNASIPLITQAGIAVPHLFAGSVVVEQIFSWPGLGRLTLESLYTHDYPMIVAIVLIIGAVVVGSNLVVDILYRVVNPQVKL